VSNCAPGAADPEKALAVIGARMSLIWARGFAAQHIPAAFVKETTMFAGHIGVAFALGRAERRLNVGGFVIAALLLDILLWLFVLLGWESVSIPADFAHTHQPAFVFHYSHGLVAGGVWSALAGAFVFAWLWSRKTAAWRGAALMGVIVFSYWHLDALVHVPEMTISSAGSPMVGLGLWQIMPVALLFESSIVVAGLWLFIPGSGLSRGRKVSLTVLALVILAFTVVGMTVAPAPPSGRAMAATSLVTLLVVCTLACWIGTPAR